MSLNNGEPPYVDEHRIVIAAPRDRVWSALRRYTESSVGVAASNPLAWLLGTEPRSGFEVTRVIPDRQLGMAGRHRFARYLLVFEITEVAAGETVVSARTHADFPGPHGRVYRALVIGTRAHVLAVNHMLRSIRRLSLG